MSLAFSANLDQLLDLRAAAVITDDEVFAFVGDQLDIHGEQHASSPDTGAEIEASNLSTLVDTGEAARRRLAWHSSSAVSRRVNDLERANQGRSWDPAWGPQPPGLTAARMAALLDLFAEEEVETEAPTWAFPATDPRSQLPEVKKEEA